MRGHRVRIGLGAPTQWRMPWRDQIFGLRACRESNLTTAPATPASGSIGSNGCLWCVHRRRVSGSARLSVFCAPAQEATGDMAAGVAGRRAIRAPVVSQKSRRDGRPARLRSCDTPRGAPRRCGPRLNRCRRALSRTLGHLFERNPGGSFAPLQFFALELRMSMPSGSSIKT